jgi:hypothetical protein
VGRGGENNLDTDAILYGRWRAPSRPALQPSWSDAIDLWNDVEANGQNVHRLEAGDLEYIYWMNNDRFTIEYKVFEADRETNSGQISLPGNPTAIHDMVALPDGRIMVSWEAAYRKHAFALLDVNAPIEFLLEEPTHYDPTEEKLTLFRGEPMLVSRDGDRLLLRHSADQRRQAIRTSEMPEGVICEEILDGGIESGRSQLLIWSSGEMEGFVVLSEDPNSPDQTFRVEHQMQGKGFSSLAAFLPGRDGHPPAVIARDQNHELFFSGPECGQVPIPSDSPVSPWVRAERAEDGSVVLHWRNMSGSHLATVTRNGEAEAVSFDHRFSQLEALPSGAGIELFWLEEEDDTEVLKTATRPLSDLATAPETKGETLARSRHQGDMMLIDRVYIDGTGNPGLVWTESNDREDTDPVFSVRRAIRR